MKRSQLAALSVHQALESGSVYFLTLTYDDDNCPVSVFDPSVDAVVGFERGAHDFAVDDHFENSLLYSEDGTIRAASLCREDVKKWLKLCRTRYKRKFGESLNCKYCFFGEYGDRRGRPHFHGLIYGLTPKQVHFMRSCWNYGFTSCIPEHPRPVSVEEVVKISKYVSKYISKGIHQRFAFILPFVERPRRQSSINFGDFSERDLSALSAFMMDATWDYNHANLFCLDVRRILSYVSLLIEETLSSWPDRSLVYPNL